MNYLEQMSKAQPGDRNVQTLEQSDVPGFVKDKKGKYRPANDPTGPGLSREQAIAATRQQGGSPLYPEKKN